jgi:glycosyltransferase involved in cell wall biosynthesis
MIGRDEIDPRTWGLPNVQVLPPQPQATLRNYYIAADLLVLPSTGEGFPLALQESLSCGLPAAVSQEIADFVPDAPLVEIDVRSLPALLHTLDRVVLAPKRLLDLRNAASEYAKRWDWANVALQYENLFIKSATFHP